MEGKLKEKLESMGLAFLCLSTGHLVPFHHWCKLNRGFFFVKIFFLAGMAGIICFTLTIRLAYASLMKKLQARDTKEKKKSVRIDLTLETLPPSSPVQKTIGVINVFNSSTDTKKRDRAMTLDTSLREVNLCFFFKLKSSSFFLILD
jgi:hypothetical protein